MITLLMSLGTKNRLAQNATRCRDYLRQTHSDQLELVNEFIAEMEMHKIACDPVQDQGYGRLTKLTLPGGGKLGVYQPRHARPAPMT